jgi:hypothetical protein
MSARWLAAVILLGGGAACTSVLALDDYSAPAAGTCVAKGCLPCLVAKCDSTTIGETLGPDPMHRDTGTATCAKYAECLCNCVDASCAASCRTAANAEAGCGGALIGLDAACGAAATCGCD